MTALGSVLAITGSNWNRSIALLCLATIRWRTSVGHRSSTRRCLKAAPAARIRGPAPPSIPLRYRISDGTIRRRQATRHLRHTSSSQDCSISTWRPALFRTRQALAKPPGQYRSKHHSATRSSCETARLSFGRWPKWRRTRSGDRRSE